MAQKMRRVLVLAAALAGLVVSGTTAGAQEPAAQAPKPASPREVFESAPADDGAIHTAQDASFTDGLGDTFAPANGAPVSECRSDIQFYGASYTEPNITLWVNTACNNPVNSSNWFPGISFVAFDIETTGDGFIDYYVVIQKNDSGTFVANVYRASDDAFLCSANPGWNGANSFSAGFAAGCIGSPGGIRIQAGALWDENPFGATCVCPSDLAPNFGVTGWILRSYPNIPVGDGPGAASAAAGQMDVFVRGQNNRLYTQHYNGSTWGGYVDLGGIITSTPGAASRLANTLDVFVRGQDNALYTQFYNGSTWGGWVRLGGILTTAPAVVSRSPGTLDVFVAGFDRALYTMHFNGSSWGGWQNLGGIITATPAAASANSGTMAVYARGQDNALYTQTFNGASWSGWIGLGGIFTTAPGASSRATGTYDVFARGQDNALWTNRFNGAAWSGWISLGGVAASPPAAVSPGDGTSNTFIRGQNARLYWNRTDPSGNNWSGWIDLGGVIL